MVSMRKFGSLAAGIVAAVAGLAAWLGPWWGEDGPRLPTESAARARGQADLLPVLVMLEPGTVVESDPPPGWSDPVIKSVTHLASGDMETLPAVAKTSATRFRTVVLADARRDPDGGGFRLLRIGAGLGTIREGRDTIIDSESLDTLGVELPTLDRMVLRRAERALGRSRLAARTPTFALYDSFVELADEGGKHRSIVLRYAMLIDPRTGALRTAYWTVAEPAASRQEPESLTLLPSNLIFRCGVHVAAKRVIGNLASSWGFAMTSLPPGATIPMPSALRALSTREPDEFDAGALEIAVRDALGERVPPPPQAP